MRTTIYINDILKNKLKNASEEMNISKDNLISILLSRIINSNSFNSRPYETVKYQDSYPDGEWEKEHVEFEPVFYEQAQDLKRNFKYSVSWFISYAIINYLDDIVEKVRNPENLNYIVDNYQRNFVYISKLCGETQVFITMLGIPEEKYLEKLLI